VVSSGASADVIPARKEAFSLVPSRKRMRLSAATCAVSALPSVNSTPSRSVRVRTVLESSHSHAVARPSTIVPSGSERRSVSYTAWRYGDWLAHDASHGANEVSWVTTPRRSGSAAVSSAADGDEQAVRARAETRPPAATARASLVRCIIARPFGANGCVGTNRGDSRNANTKSFAAKSFYASKVLIP
jgi:hypothetical protein